MNKRHIFSSESVGEGHPDKVADSISDAVLDACLAQDPESHVACETLVKDNHVILAGEIRTQAVLDFESIVRDTIYRIGYRDEHDDPVFNAKSFDLQVLLSQQSPDIAQGVDAVSAEGKDGSEQGAGDQGIMFGYASNETPELMPAPIMFAHRIMAELTRVRRTGEVAWLRPDSKSQVAIEHDDHGRPERVVNVVLSTQHTEDVDIATIRSFCEELIRRVIPAELITEDTQFYINPTGRFVVGGPNGDSGLTGRKIIVDTYGGKGRHGGGAFSGKDSSKVDRSSAYMCRWVAKHVVAAGLADTCELQLAYAIGMANPVSIMVDAHRYDGAGLSSEEIAERIAKVFSFKPADIVSALGLKRPLFTASTNYGHFGRDGLPWEEIKPELIAALRGE